MFKKIFVCLILSTFSVQALSSVNSEYWYQASAGEKFIEGDLAYDYLDFGQVDFSDLKVNVKYEQGLTEIVSWYAQIGYGQGKYNTGKSSSDFKGFEPFNIGLKTQNIYENGRLISDFNFGYELEKGEEENRTNGVMTMSFGLGYEHSILGDSLIGAYGSYVFLSTDSKQKDTDDITPTNGDVKFDLYFEKHVSNFVLGAKATYKYGSIGNVNNYVQDLPFPENLDSSTVSINSYGRLSLSEKLTLTGELFYSQIVNGTTNIKDDSTGYGAKFGARFKF